MPDPLLGAPGGYEAGSGGDGFPLSGGSVAGSGLGFLNGDEGLGTTASAGYAVSSFNPVIVGGAQWPPAGAALTTTTMLLGDGGVIANVVDPDVTTSYEYLKDLYTKIKDALDSLDPATDTSVPGTLDKFLSWLGTALTLADPAFWGGAVSELRSLVSRYITECSVSDTDPQLLLGALHLANQLPGAASLLPAKGAALAKFIADMINGLDPGQPAGTENKPNAVWMLDLLSTAEAGMPGVEGRHTAVKEALDLAKKIKEEHDKRAEEEEARRKKEDGKKGEPDSGGDNPVDKFVRALVAGLLKKFFG